MPSKSLLRLCVAVSQMQLVMSRANKERGYSVLHAFGLLAAYAELTYDQEATYNAARAYHHLGLTHLAVGSYERVLDREPARAAGAVHALSREAAHNLARLFHAGGDPHLARCAIRSMPVT